ncbi:MAG: ArsR/SmtB family transcription factor [Pyrinomonadaceae bacterium]
MKDNLTMGDNNYSIELLFKALADRTRLRLLNLIGEDEVCVCFFVEVLNNNQPKISRHLAYLRKAGVVSARREGKWIHYRIVEPPGEHAANIFREVRTSLKSDPAMQRDRARLAQICCAPQLPVQLQKAPRPATLVA